ncbi:MAG: prolyl oligopeptidase family serine peptidase [Flavobacteriaceae bacterium]|nr:prolyl oligopeptidase family serine peptidase [Flavobacteriaceae bacterium]
MIKKLLFLVFIFFIFQCKHKEINDSQKKLSQKPVSDTIHGKVITDDYRYMENLEDSVVLDWYKNQAYYTKQKISKINGRKKIIKLQDSLNKKNTFKISHLNITNNDKYFYLKSEDGKVEQLYFRDGFNKDEQLLFNPGNYKEGYSINYISPNWNGTKVAIAITKNDLEIGDILIYDIAANKLHNEVIKNCWPSALGGIRWHPDNLRFTYEYLPVIDKKNSNYLLNLETRIHRVGQNVSSDIDLFSKKNNSEIDIKEEDFPEISFKDEKSTYMFASVSGASYYADYYYAPTNTIDNDKIIWKPLFKEKDLIRRFYVDGDDIIFLTANEAKNFKICKTSLISPNFKNPKVIVPHDEKSVITDLTLTNNGLYFVKTKNGVEAKLYKLDYKGIITNIPIPKKAGNINVSSKGYIYSDLWMEIRGWGSEKEMYKYNYDLQKFVEHQLVKKNGYKAIMADVVIEELEVASHDGTKVPLSIIYKKGIEKKGGNRMFMTGYGALGYSFRPALNSYLLHWINEGGIYAVAHVRGGGEKGNAWHKDGHKTTKPNSWKDFIACTEYLIKENYTSPRYISISGASAGGILIGRPITERPDLYAAAIIRVGVLNTLRSEFAPNGKNLSKDFGSIKDSIEFKALLEMDAYQHITMM